MNFTRRGFLEFVEPQLNLGRSIFTRRDENICPRTSQCTSEVNLDFSIVAFLKFGMPSSGAVCRCHYARSCRRRYL